MLLPYPQGDVIMFKPNDTVRTRSPKHPFWMTVVSVREDIQIAYCRFGSHGTSAGGFRFDEIEAFNPLAASRVRNR